MAGARTDGVVGRAAELEVLAGFVSALAHGQGGAVVVEGEAGIGKSRLVAEAATAARAAGVTVMEGRAEDLDRTRPFRTIGSALGARPGSADPELAAIARMLNDAHETANVGHRVHEACLGVIERSALHAPTLLCLEDVHWADLGTISVVRTIARQLAELPIGVLMTARLHPRGDELQALFDDLAANGGTRLRVPPLDDDAARQLVGYDGATWNARAGGNPFFLLELARADDVSESDAALPADVQETLLRRIRELPGDVVEVLQVASILGPGFALTDLASVMRRPVQDLVPLISSALQAGFLVEAVGGLRFRHDLIREALEAALPRTVAAALHLETGWALAAAGADAVRVAPHLVAGAQPGDVEAIAWLRRAGHQASRRNLATGLELLRAAVELASPRPDEAHQIEAETIPLLAWSGQFAAAIERGEALLRRPLPARLELDVRRALAETWALLGGTEEPAAHADAGLAVPGVPTTIAAELLAFRSLRPGDRAASHADLEKAQRLAAGPEGSVEAAATVAVIRAFAEVDERHLLRAVSVAEEAVTLTRRAAGSGTGEGREAASMLLALGVHAKALYLADRVREAVAVTAEARSVAEGLGAEGIVASLTRDLAQFACDMGEFDTALTEIEVCEALTGDQVAAVYIRYPIFVNLGDWERAEATWAACTDAKPPPPDHYLDMLRARHLSALGRDVEALDMLRAAWVAAQGGIWLSRTGSALLIRLALAAGDHPMAVDVAAEADRLAAADAVDSLRATALVCEAMLSGDPTPAQTAVDLLRPLGEPVPLALAIADLARVAAAAGETERATASATEAVALLEGIGADPAIAGPLPLRAKRPNKRAARPTFGWESLTPTELRVIAALAEGLSNPQIAARLFVSRHTVESHLKHVFAKLGIGSRVELAAEAVRRQLRVTSP